MNDANKQASGFKLSTLSRLGMLKDDKNESTFADLVERIVRNQYSGWENFTDEISGVLTAQKINVEQLQTDAKRYIDNIKNIQMSLDAGNLSDPTKFHPEDKVSIVVQRHMKEARRKSEQLAVFLEDMQKSYDDIMAFYGEDPSDDNARREFFAKLANFVNEWKVSFYQLSLYELLTDTCDRNPKKRTPPSKTNGAATKSPCAAKPPKQTPTRSPPTPCLPTPTRPNPPRPPAPWTTYSRNFALRSPKRATSVTAVVEPASRIDTRCVLRRARRSLSWGLMWRVERRAKKARRLCRQRARRARARPAPPPLLLPQAQTPTSRTGQPPCSKVCKAAQV
jgi:hypothetical protein